MNRITVFAQELQTNNQKDEIYQNIKYSKKYLSNNTLLHKKRLERFKDKAKS